MEPDRTDRAETPNTKKNRWTSDDLEEIYTYHNPTDEQINNMQHIRNQAIEFAIAINRLLPDCADKMDALRKVREAQMTANAGIMLKGKV